MDKLSKEKSFSRLARRAVDILLERFDERFSLNDDMVLASFLDPSMQHLPIIQEYFEKNNIDVVELLNKKWVKYELTLRADSEKSNPVPTAVNRKELEPAVNAPKRIRLDIEKHCSMEAVMGNSPIDCIRREFNKYTSIVGVLEEPLSWWQKNEAQFPHFSRLAKVMLSFMATSAIVERFFSKAAILVTKRKASLNPTTIEKILFIHENYSLVKDYFT